MEKPQLRQLTVKRKSLITKHMLRVTLGGAGMEGFPEGRESANCKLVLPSTGDSPAVRTYTVRNHRPKSAEVDIDFVLHAEHGPASSWALQAEAGDTIGFAGPGKVKLVDFSADWFLLVGDMSALPAIGANIDQLPDDARGHVVLEVIDEDDRQPLGLPEGMEVEWVINPAPHKPGSTLLEAVAGRPWLEGRVAAWVAGESTITRRIRRYLKQEQRVPRGDLYASGYWQIGLTEDRHQVVKKQEPED